MHYCHKTAFLSTLSELGPSSANRGYELYSADNMYKIKREFKDKKDAFVEEFDNVSYFVINEDGTYAYKYVGSYLIETPAKNFTTATDKELKPLTEAIAFPDWAK